MDIMTTTRRTLDRARRLPASLRRTGGWPLALGALLLVGSAAGAVATTNSPPQIGGLRLSSHSVNEGEPVSLVGVFSDPDASNRHTVRIAWYGPDEGGKQEIQLPAGTTHFEATHVYKDNFPPTPIKVTVYDRDLPDGANDNTGGNLSDAEFLEFEVRNVEPEFVESSIKVEKKGRLGVIVEGDFTDPGTDDRMQVFATWSDRNAPETTVCGLTNGNRHFRCEHTYQGPVGFGISRTHTIGLIVKDDEGGYDEYETKVQLK